MKADEIEQVVLEKKPIAPRVTKEHIESVVADETYTVLPSGKVMVCELILRNGFSVRGEASAVSKENFNIEIGRQISRDRALQQVWLCEGYLLQEQLYQQKLVDESA